ncbi:hypothetical protein [Cupriavidus sp. DL-D2]|uniref:hypothetical protein n=1 Tax=Cupriavidus sp. DL-D2 TaxID=3144974 RepID=UPI003212A1D7
MTREIAGKTVINGAYRYVFATIQEAQEFLVCLEDDGVALVCALRIKPLRVEHIRPSPPEPRNRL